MFPPLFVVEHGLLPGAKLPATMTASLTPLAGTVAHVASPRQNVEALAPVPLFRFPTGKFPVTPPLPLDAKFAAGMSAPVIDRNDGLPALPFGAARNVFADWLPKSAPTDAPKETLPDAFP